MMREFNRIVYHLPDHGIGGCLDFGYYKYASAQPKLEVHKHLDSLELCFCIRGEQQYLIEETLIELKGDDILIVPPNKYHSTGDFPEDKGVLFWLQISLAETQGLLCNLPKAHSRVLLDELLKISGDIIVGALQIKYYLDLLLKELKASETILSTIKINQLILQILLETLRCSQRQKKPQQNERLLKVDAFIIKNMHRTIYIDELASCLQLSTGYFKTWFLSKSGVTPKEYVNRFKIQHAKPLLLESESITAVAFELGYSSSQYFATIFKKFTGQTPSSFIKTSEV